MGDFFVLFETNPIIEGFTKDIIIDIQRSKIINIPKSLTYIVKKLNSIGKENTYSLINNKIVLNEYIDFLLQNELGIFCDKEEKKYFPKLNLKFNTPSFVNVITATVKFPELDQLFNLIEIAKTYHALFILKLNDIDTIDSFLLKISNSRLNGIDIIVNNSINLDIIDYIIKHCPKLLNIYVYNQKNNLKETYDNKIIYYIENSFEFYLEQQNSSPSILLNNNLQTYLESKSKNLFYNKKLYIDEHGFIFPSINIKESIGNINKITDKSILLQLINNSSLSILWDANKNKTDICKSCEFRFNCIDNRVPIKKEDATYYHTNPCNYNPYIAKWKDEVGYKSLEECGVISTKNRFEIDYKKIKAITKELWGDE